MKFKSDKYYFIVSIDNDKYIEALFNDIVKIRCSQNNLSCEYFSVNSGTEFINLFQKIEQEVKDNNVYPFIHIECHGSQDGVKLKSGMRLTWENVGELIQKINIASKNNLIVSMASCFGGNLTIPLYQSIDINNKGRSVALGIIGPVETIMDYQLEEGFSKFFDDFLISRNLVTAIDQLNKYSRYEKRYVFQTNVSIFKKVIDFYISKMKDEDFKNKKAIRDKMNKIERSFMLETGRKLSHLERRKLLNKITDKNFYIDFFNEIRDDYFMIDLYPENDKRFPKIDNIEGFDETIKELLSIK